MNKKFEKNIEKPVITVSGKKILFKSKLHHRIVQDLPQEEIEWRRLDGKPKSVYIDIDFVDFDVDNVQRSSERSRRLFIPPTTENNQSNSLIDDETGTKLKDQCPTPRDVEPEVDDGPNSTQPSSGVESNQDSTTPTYPSNDASSAFFNQKLLGRPVLHTFWADKTDFEGDGQKSQFEDWIGQVQASACTEWAIVIIEDGDLKTQIGTALFKSKLQSSASQPNVSSASTGSLSHHPSSSLLDRMKKSLSTMFQSDSNSDRWLTLINQERTDHKAQESYASFLKKFRSVIMASFSKQIELFEEQLRVQREMRKEKDWNFLSYFLLQEELAFAFEFLTLFDEALVQYNLLDALFSEHISSPSFDKAVNPLYEQWTSFTSWPALCLDMNSDYSNKLRKCIVEKKASLLEIRNYLFAKQCDLMLMQNQPWRVAASTNDFLQNCIREHEFLKIETFPGSLTCWSFVSALEVLQKCECYSCTSTMENYSFHTVDIWNNARRKLLELGRLSQLIPSTEPDDKSFNLRQKLMSGLGPDPHSGISCQENEISPQKRLCNALTNKEKFSQQMVEISELTLGTYKHIGRKRCAQLVAKDLAEFYIDEGKFSKAYPFLLDVEKNLVAEKWDILIRDIRGKITRCNEFILSSQVEEVKV